MNENKIIKDLLRVLKVEYTDEKASLIERYFKVSRVISTREDADQFTDVVNFVCEVNLISRESFFKNGRFRDVVDTRREAAFILSEMGYKYSLIGDLMGKDRTTTLYYLESIRERFEIDKRYKKRFFENYHERYYLGALFDDYKKEHQRYIDLIKNEENARNSELQRIRDIEAMPSL